MRIIFFGTPTFAVPTLESLIASPHDKVVALLTQPDRAAGRGKHIFAPPTKLVANRYSIPVYQPEKLSREPDLVQVMKDLKPDIIITAAFGQILKEEVLNLAPYGVMNLHASLLPAYRGAAPINWAIINGESTSGLTTMFSDPGIDTGDILLKREVSIGPDENVDEYSERLSYIGSDLVIETLDRLREGQVQRLKQDDTLASMAPRLTKDLGIIDWSKSALDLHNLVRGLYGWPGTSSQIAGSQLKILSTQLSLGAEINKGCSPGEIVAIGTTISVACGADGGEVLDILQVQPPNKAAMSAKDWANGARIKSGMMFSMPTPRATHEARNT